MLSDYLKHIEKHPDSLLARIYGLYTIKTSVFGALSIIILQNISQPYDKANSRMIFDLKGSTVNRKVKFESKFWLEGRH